MEYEDKAKRVNALCREYAVLKGMINEVIMSCLILKDKVKKEKAAKIRQGDYNMEPSYELHEEVTSKLEKFGRRINKYKKRLSQIAEELQEYGIDEL